MKLSKDQKDIIKAINDGSVYDIYSYLEHFKMLRCFCIDKSKIDQAFLEKEHGRTYKVLKSEIEPFYMQFNPVSFSNNLIRNELKEDDYVEKPATLDYSNTILKREYREQAYYFDPCDVNEINIATTFSKIIDFLTIWNYLRSEFLILEMPKDIRKEEIGVFFERRNLCHPEIEVGKGESLLSEDQALLLMGSHEPPKRDALQYIDEFLEFNNEMFTICNGYLDKKVIATPEMNLYIKRHFNTKEQLHFILMLFAAYLTIIISVCMPLFQKQDNSEVIKIQQQLAVMQEEVHDLKSTDKQLLEVLNDLSQNPYDSSAIESLLEEIKEDISNIN